MNTRLAGQVVRDPRVTPVIAVVGAMILTILIIAITMFHSIRDLQNVAEERGRLHQQEQRQIHELQQERDIQDKQIRRLRRQIEICADLPDNAPGCQVPDGGAVPLPTTG